MYTTGEKTKLTGIAEGAQPDQTGAEIKTAYEGEANAYTDTKDTKLEGIDAGAEVNPADLAALDPTQNTKLNGIEDGATIDQTDTEIRNLILGLADIERKIVITEPIAGEFPIISLQRDADGKTKVSYDNVPI